MEGKKVVFVEDENDLVNADGLNGYFESVGDSSHIPTVYEVCVKRGIDKLLSFLHGNTFTCVCCYRTCYQGR